MNTNHGYQLRNGTIDDGCCQFQRSGQICKLFIIGEQVMADKVAYEDFYNVFGIGNEF